MKEREQLHHEGHGPHHWAKAVAAACVPIPSRWDVMENWRLRGKMESVNQELLVIGEGKEGWKRRVHRC